MLVPCKCRQWSLRQYRLIDNSGSFQVGCRIILIIVLVDAFVFSGKINLSWCFLVAHISLMHEFESRSITRMGVASLKNRFS